MLSKKFLSAITVAVTFGIFMIAACNKNKDTDTEDNTGLGNDHAVLEKVNNDVDAIADQAGTTGSVSMREGATILGNCATVTRDTLSNPRIITIDFGSSNCLCNDGNYRRGRIIVTYTGHYKDNGSVHTISFNNYFVNDNQLKGSKTVTNMGMNNNGQYYYNINVNDSVVLANNNGTISWTSMRTRTWTAGYSTGDWHDDAYQVEGSGTVTRANGKTFTLNITSPLIVSLDCHWIKQGTVQITPQNAVVRTLDYGNGTCDALATFTVSGHTYNISLH